MTTLKTDFKKTGYSDIDSLLLKAHLLKEESAQLQNQIKEALQFKPSEPSKSDRRRKWFA